MDLISFIPLIEISLAHAEESNELSKLANASMNSVALDTDYPFYKSIEANIIGPQKPFKFIKEETKLFFYTLYFIEKNCENTDNEAEWTKFFKIYLSGPDSILIKRTGLIGYDMVILIANRIYRLDVAKLICQGDVNIRRAIMISLVDTLPYLIADTNVLIEALIISTKKITVEGNYVNLYDSIQTTSFNNEIFGRRLIEISQADARKKYLFTPSAFLGLTKKQGLTNTINIVKEFIASDIPEDIQVGLYCLNELSTIPTEIINHKEELLKILYDAENHSSYNAKLINTYARFVHCFPEVIEIIFSIYNKDNSDDVFHSLSFVAFILAEKYYNENWYQTMFSLLENIHNKPAGCYYNVEQTLKIIFRKSPERVLSYFKTIISHPKWDKQDIQGFKNFFKSMADAQFSLLQTWITLWLNDDNFRFHEAVSDICSILWLQKKYDIELDVSLLNTLKANDLEFIFYKIVGYYYSKEHLESLTYSMTKYVGEAQDFLASLYTYMFINYILRNYSSSIRYLESKKPSATPYQLNIIEAIEEYYNETYNIDGNKPKELAYSTDRIQIFFKHLSKSQNSESKSNKFPEHYFLNGVTPINLKLGKSFFFRDEKDFQTGRKFEEASEMITKSTSFEMPHGEIADPVGMRFNRLMWRNFKRRQL